MRSVWRKRRFWLAVAAGLVVLLLVPTVWMSVSTAGQRYSVDDAVDRPVTLVLGAGLEEDGSPSRFLAARLDIAAELHAAGKTQVVLVSGDNSVESYDETGAMRDYLVRAGVPEDRVVADHAGFSTWESCARARDVFGVDSAIVVTQRFHLPRAVRLCRAAGIDTVGVGDPSGQRRLPTTVYGYAREIPAAVKATASILVQPEPTFPGPEEDGVTEALESAP